MIYSMSQALYDILCIPKSSSSSEIKKSFMKLAKVNHPDKGGDAEIFKKMVHAYEVLCDDKLRTMYDSTGVDPGDNENATSGGMSAGFPFDIGGIFSMFGQGVGGMGGPFGPMGGGFGFSASVPNNGRREGKPPAKIEVLNVEMKYLYKGNTITIQLDRMKKCTGCDGCGFKNRKTCTSCGGARIVSKIVQMGPVIMKSSGPCDTCRGRGFISSDNCDICSGSCVIQEKQSCVVDIVPGTCDGDKIVLSEVCSETGDFEKRGDLVLVIQQVENRVWKRSGLYSENLNTGIVLNMSESLSGCIVKIDEHPLYGDGLFVRIPPCTFERDILIVKGAGMPIKGKTGAFGDILITITVNCTKKERSILTNSECRGLHDILLGENKRHCETDRGCDKIYDVVLGSL